MKDDILDYNPQLIFLARKLRKNMTLSEVLLWKKLKSKQLYGYSFNRQKPISSFIVDFYCKELRLAIEIDGCSHQYDDVIRKDDIKEKDLELLKIHVLRFDDLEVKKDISSVLRKIEDWINDNRNLD